jgi:hypothetical protein
MFWLIGYGSRLAMGRDMEWADDLVSPDPVVRAEAVLRFKQAQADLDAAQRGAGDLGDALGRELMRTLWDGWTWVDFGAENFPSGSAELIHYSLRYLEWEARFPAEWYKSWGTKGSLLRAMARRDDLTEDARSRLADLVVTVVSRRQQCEDEGYIAVARAIDDESLRQRVAEVESSRARFMLHMLDHLELRPKTRTWQLWEAEQVSG